MTSTLGSTSGALVMLATLAGAWPQDVAAQTAANPAPATADTPRGAPIYVTLKDGLDVTGSLLELSTDSVALLTAGGPRTVPLDEVRRIQRRGDPSGDGAVKGAIVVGLWCARICGQAMRGDHLAAAVLVNAGVGALLGWMLDRSHVGRTTIYPQRASGVIPPDRR